MLTLPSRPFFPLPEAPSAPEVAYRALDQGADVSIAKVEDYRALYLGDDWTLWLDGPAASGTSEVLGNALEFFRENPAVCCGNVEVETYAFLRLDRGPHAIRVVLGVDRTDDGLAIRINFEVGAEHEFTIDDDAEGDDLSEFLVALYR